MPIQRGKLATIVPLFSKIADAAWIIASRRMDKELKNLTITTSDSCLYRVEDGEPVLYLGGPETNLVFANIAEAANQLGTQGNYYPPIEQAKEVIAQLERSRRITRVALHALELIPSKTRPGEYGHFIVEPAKPNGLNPAQTDVAIRVYGGDRLDKGFGETMGYFMGGGIEQTAITVLLPENVERLVSNEEDSIARLCFIGDAVSKYPHSFTACGRHPDDEHRLYGVLEDKG
ncbi:MAG: hypothetical protein ABIE94_06745 [archaeon]